MRNAINLRPWLLAGLVLAGVSFFAAQTLATAAEKPNIIYILADDLGYGDLSCYGQKTLATPNLDRMAAEGMKFTRHYAGCPVCAPSRCVLMTGKHTGHCTVRGNGDGPMNPEDVTVAEVLKAAGYATGCVGKWGIGNPPPRDDPNQQGFDYFYGYANMFHAHNFFPEFLIENGEKVPLRNVTMEEYRDVPDFKEGVGVAEKKVDYAPDFIARKGLDFIEEHKDGPFFLYFAMNIPHANNEGGGNKEQRNGMEVLDYGVFTDRDWPEPEKGFATIMGNVDRYVGDVLERLRVLGIEKNTLVLFSSDNGPHAEGRHELEFFDSNGKLRGMKRDVYQGGVREPMLAWWPGTIEAGTETDHLSGFQDVLVTLAGVAGVPDAEVPETDGLSFLPTLLGEPGEQKKHEYLYWEFHEKGGKRGVVTERWSAIRLNTDENPDGPVELYDLKADEEETRDVAAEHPDVVEKLTGYLEAAHVDQ